MKKIEQLRTMFESGKPVTTASLHVADIPTKYLTDLARRGEVCRVGVGVYVSTSTPVLETFGYEEVACVMPTGVICLISALRFHELSDENPHKIDVALERGTRRPKTNLPVEFHSFTGEAYSFGIETRKVNGAEIRVYSVEKTIADCFKFRSKVGLDVAANAMREATKKKLIDYGRLWESSKICRITNLIQHYMEAIR